MRLIGLAVVLAVSLILAPVAAEAQQADRLRDLATELVDLKVDLTVTGGPTATRAAQQATRSLPVIMAWGGDPIEAGFVASTDFKADLVVLDERQVRPAMPTVESDLPVRVPWPVAARPRCATSRRAWGRRR
jgi:hypothetical protein